MPTAYIDDIRARASSTGDLNALVHSVLDSFTGHFACGLLVRLS